MDISLLEIANTHDESSGTAPSFMKRSKDEFYCSYFESACGDQLIFIFNRQTRIGYFWSGGLGWDRRIEVSGNIIQDADLIISREEFEWLRICWRAATDGELEQPVKKCAVKSNRKSRKKKPVRAKSNKLNKSY